MRTVNVERMRRYQERTRPRHVWTDEEKSALLDHMRRRVAEMNAEDRADAEHRARRAARSGTIPGYWFDREGILRALPLTLDDLDRLAPGVPYPVPAEMPVPCHASMTGPLRTIQRKAGIVADGIMGPQTWLAACEVAGGE